MSAPAATADVGSLKYRWQVSAGKIVGGQGTLRITVDTTGVGGGAITATIEMNDGNNHVTMSSCNIAVLAHRKD